MQMLAIILEVLIVIVALKAAQFKKTKFAYGFVLTFGLYVLFDSARQFNLPIPQDLLHILFFIATVSALWTVWQLSQLK